MASYEEAFAGLNEAQKLAVTTTDGPVLVIAGPGTGKTQLLTTRIAHILKTTDTLPQNILCLTFTESAAQTMRTRLADMIGQAAYDVTISTYHAFGSDLIRRFPDYFTELADMQPVDDLGLDAIFREILEKLPFSNLLKFADVYLPDLKTFVSDAKRALLTPAGIHELAQHNEQFLQLAQPLIGKTLDGMLRIDKKAISLFTQLAEALPEAAAKQNTQPPAGIEPLSQLLISSLTEAVTEAAESGKTTSLTKWKNTWLAKDAQGRFVIDGARAHAKLHAAADIYEQYLAELTARGLFDYDDMILRAVHALSTNADLRYTLQEQYLYILLDEFQDTNGAQLRLVELLTDNPASEGRPNVLAVGDDDQAIYAFQGANYSHMLGFQQLYRDVLVVPLTKNYRSHAAILHVARGIAEQIEERLHHHFPQIEKVLTAENTSLPKHATLERREAKSDVGELAWTAKHIKELTKHGLAPNNIAVLAPQHKYLEPLVPFLQQAGVPVRYEKRENVLDDPAITQLIRMSELCLALGAHEQGRANALWAEVLSFSFWDLPTSLIWKLSWQSNDDRESWTDELLEQPALKPIALFFVRLSQLVATETLETMLDYLVGVALLDLGEPGEAPFTSPFYAHYFGNIADGRPALFAPGDSTVAEPKTAGRDSGLDTLFYARERSPGANSAGRHNAGFWQLLTNLTVLRARLKAYQATGEQLRLTDLTTFVSAHRAANLKVLNTSPYQEADDAVQLMTAFKAKGMEFDAVFVLAVNDEAWGSKARTQSTRLSLPANLQFIRYAGATNDERLRLFYVAVTRAKSQLYLVNYQQNYAGRTLTRLKYLDEHSAEDGAGRSPLLPEGYQDIQAAEDNGTQPTTELAAYWQQRHEAALEEAGLQALIKQRLEQFQLSPTHVTSFIDLEHQGPLTFFMNTILRFPQAPTPTVEFGNAMHETLEWIHLYNRQHGALPGTPLVLSTFEQRLRTKQLNELNKALFLQRGETALRAYLQQRAHTIQAANEAEYNFRNEGVFIGDCHMAGKIDKLIVDKATRTITIVDYKTGKSHQRWTHEPKLHRYRTQLYLYKALVEASHTFAGYTVTDAYLEFVEPDEDGKIQELHLTFDERDFAHTKQLAQAVWHAIQTCKTPDSKGFTADMKGIEAFETDLLRQFA